MWLFLEVCVDTEKKYHSVVLQITVLLCIPIHRNRVIKLQNTLGAVIYFVLRFLSCHFVITPVEFCLKKLPPLTIFQ